MTKFTELDGEGKPQRVRRRKQYDRVPRDVEVWRGYCLSHYVVDQHKIVPDGATCSECIRRNWICATTVDIDGKMMIGGFPLPESEQEGTTEADKEFWYGA